MGTINFQEYCNYADVSVTSTFLRTSFLWRLVYNRECKSSFCTYVHSRFFQEAFSYSVEWSPVDPQQIIVPTRTPSWPWIRQGGFVQGTWKHWMALILEDWSKIVMVEPDSMQVLHCSRNQAVGWPMGNGMSVLLSLASTWAICRLCLWRESWRVYLEDSSTQMALRRRVF